MNNDGFTKDSMDQLTDFKIKWDFSDKYIVATIGVKGESRDRWLQNWGKDWTERFAMKGSFTYSDSKLSKATIESAAWKLVSQSPSGSHSSDEGGGIAIYASGSKLKPDGTAISNKGFPYPADWSPTIPDTKSWSSIWDHVVNKMYGLDLDIPGDDPFIYNIPGVESYTALAKPQVDNFGNGKIFSSGWETTAFSQSPI